MPSRISCSDRWGDKVGVGGWGELMQTMMKGKKCQEMNRVERRANNDELEGKKRLN